MEKGIARLVEAATVAAERSDHEITLEITVEGVRAKIKWTVKTRDYTAENLTTWKQLNPAPNTRNPLLSALDSLLQARTEYEFKQATL